MLSANWNSLVEYIEAWYPHIKALEEKRLEAKQHALEHKIAPIPPKMGMAAS
jgi:hypothetical protein